MNLEELQTQFKLTAAELEECRVLDGKSKTEQVRMLRAYRQNLTDSLHQHQKLLDKIDYILFEINKSR